MNKKVDPKYSELAKAIISRDKDLKAEQFKYDAMSRLQYALPDSLSGLDWVRKQVSTLPYDALKGATRALSNLEEAVSIDPVSVMKAVGDDESRTAKELANRWERVLKWELGRSSKRRRNLRAAAIWDAATYDEIIAQLIHIPTQFKLSQPSLARKRSALRFGDWAVRMIDPKSAYVTYSDYMPESVLVAQVMKAREIVNEWPDRVPELIRKIKTDAEFANENFIVFDYVDHDIGRTIWYAKGETAAEGQDSEGKYILEPEPWMRVVDGDNAGQQVPFLNYVAVSGPDPRRPLLYPVLQSGMWDTTNIMGTIVMSKAVATAAAPEHIIFGPGAEDIDIDYRTPGGRLTFPSAQMYQYQPAPARPLDPKLIEGYDRLEAQMQRATVAEVLVQARPISGEQAFASYNLQVQQALASIGNIKELGERFFEQLYESMLLISHFRGENIESYMDGNKKYVIDSEEIDPDSIQLSVELKTDVPIDRLARINAAAQLAGSGIPYPFEEILESLGATDPEGLKKKYAREQIEMADLQGVIEAVRMERSGELQQMAQQMAQQIVQQEVQRIQEIGRQARQNPADQGPRGEEANPRNLSQAPGGVGPGGQGFNPAQGGRPTAEADPEGATREARQAIAGLGPIGRV